MLYGTLIIEESNFNILWIELFIAFIGAIVNSYLFVKNLNNRI